MTLGEHLRSKGLSQRAIEDLLPYIPEHDGDGVFRGAASITKPDTWFHWPDQTRFVVVGLCPNGDGVAIDTQNDLGAVFYVAHELLGGGLLLDDVVVRVADSPSTFIHRFVEDEKFPYDYWEAKKPYRLTGAFQRTTAPSQRLGGCAVRGRS